jgi:hypothetical protein
MSFEKKIKTALDELRMLMMGAQILLGFQFQAPFQATFDRLPIALQLLNVVACALMIGIVGMLILPNAYHRTVADGEATAALQRLIRRVAAITMLPLAAAVAIDVLLALQQILTPETAIVVASTIFTCACCLWYAAGFGREAEAGKDRVMPENTRGRTSLSAKIEYVLTEARVVLPGAQTPR